MKEDKFYANDLAEIIITEEELQERIKELAAEITACYKPDEELVMVGILRGAVLFMADLARHINLPVIFDFMDVSSYGKGTYSSGTVRIIKDLEENIEGRHVLIVEDILDTGKTLKHVIAML